MEELRIIRENREKELGIVESLKYCYYYCHHYHHQPNSLLHSSSAVSQNSTCLTDQALLILHYHYYYHQHQQPRIRFPYFTAVQLFLRTARVSMTKHFLFYIIIIIIIININSHVSASPTSQQFSCFSEQHLSHWPSTSYSLFYQNFLAVRHVLIITAFSIRMYRAGRTVSSFKLSR